MDQSPTASSLAQVDWKRIGLFWLLACLISGLANYGVNRILPAGNNLEQLIDTSIPIGFGPLLAGLLVFRRTTFVSWTGDVPIRAWLLIGLLPLGGVIVSLTKQEPLATPLTHHLLFTASVLIYCMGEEWGWRGFLYEALLPLPVQARVVITGLLWFSWHFTFYTELLNLTFAFTFLGMIMIGALGINAAVGRTNSMAVAVCLHTFTKTMVPAPYSWGIIAITLLVVITWPQLAAQKLRLNRLKSLPSYN